jgi:hypothetical protein
MVNSTHAMIPYDRGQYPIRLVRAEDSMVIIEDTVERHSRFQRPSRAKITAVDPGDIYRNRYDSNPYWQYADDCQVGARINVYA